jgi:hypothetical protein
MRWHTAALPCLAAAMVLAGCGHKQKEDQTAGFGAGAGSMKDTTGGAYDTMSRTATDTGGKAMAPPSSSTDTGISRKQ